MSAHDMRRRGESLRRGWWPGTGGLILLLVVAGCPPTPEVDGEVPQGKTDPGGEFSTHGWGALVERGQNPVRRQTARTSLRQRSVAEVLELLLEGDDATAWRCFDAMGYHGAAGEAGLFLRLQEIVWDDAWPDDLRRGAAYALWEHGGEEERLEALRGLGLLESAMDVDFLHGVLLQPSLGEAQREAALAALTGIADRRAVEVVLELWEHTEWEGFRTELLRQAGRLPWAEIQPFLDPLVRDPETPALHREAIAEGLAGASTEARVLLWEILQTDAEPAVREQAAWALSGAEMAGETFDFGVPELVALSAVETDETVRRRLYEMAWNWSTPPSDEWMEQIYGETVLSTRVAALNAAGAAVGQGAGSAGFVERFEKEAVPDLLSIARTGPDLNVRMRAVFALRRAGTPASRAALEKLSSLEKAPSIATAAAHGLNPQPPNPMP
jgi:HEAT repeat protein